MSDENGIQITRRGLLAANLLVRYHRTEINGAVDRIDKYGPGTAFERTAVAMANAAELSDPPIQTRLRLPSRPERFQIMAEQLGAEIERMTIEQDEWRYMAAQLATALEHPYKAHRAKVLERYEQMRKPKPEGSR